MNAGKSLTHGIASAALSLVIVVLLFVPDAQAQRYRIFHGFRQTYPGAIAVGLQAGGNGNYGLNGPTAACNCEFENGSALGYHAGLHVDIFVNRYVGIRLQGLYEDLSTTYVKDRPSSIYLDDGSLAAITAQRRVESGIQYATVSFGALWFTGPAGLYLITSAGAGFYLDGTIREEEYITDPSGLLYPQTGSNRIVYRDEKLDANEETAIRASLIVGIGYDIPLGRAAAIAPEIHLDIPLTSVVEGNTDWRIAVLRASLALRFGL
ncbi:MAG: hypothetical protein JXA28_11235 [Bacteroidetes bacterium]|nr:hypothetical protein [Bacteroidota bacterium]